MASFICLRHYAPDHLHLLTDRLENHLWCFSSISIVSRRVLGYLKEMKYEYLLESYSMMEAKSRYCLGKGLGGFGSQRVGVYAKVNYIHKILCDGLVNLPKIIVV